MLRRGTAAAAQRPGAQPDHRQHIARKVLRRGGKHRLSVNYHRQAGIGLHKEGKRGAGGQGAHVVHQRRRLVSAVEAYRRHAKPLQHGHRSGNVGSGKQPAPLVKGEADKQRQLSARRFERLLCAQHAGFYLCQIRHGFDQKQIRPLFDGSDKAVLKQPDGILEEQIPIRSQKASGRPHIRGDITAPGTRDGLSGDTHTRAHAGSRIRAQMSGGCAKGVGGHDIAAGLQVAPVDIENAVRMGQVPRFGPLSAGQTHALQQRTHAAVEVQQPFAELLVNFVHGLSSAKRNAISAVTLFSGSINPPAVRLMPMRRASSQESSAPWQLRGASP